MATFQENFRSSDLTFDSDGIYWVNPEDNETYQVMMKWEEPIMKKMAEICVDEGDDVVEFGFGMGILSNAIQERKPKSHTIVECHKDIIPKLKEWAEDKPNVIILEGLWTEVTDYKQYDSILHDTYADEFNSALKPFAERYAKPQCKITWWNNNPDLVFKKDTRGFNSVKYYNVNISPPDNKYYIENEYKIPLKII